MSAADASGEGSGEALSHLERRARRFFTCGIEAAFEATWEEAKRLGLGEITIDVLMGIMNRALEKSVSRFAGLG
jgi:hypothetical protein